MLMCFNKILLDHRPANQVLSTSKVFFVQAMLASDKNPEDKFHYFYYDNSSTKSFQDVNKQ